MMRTVSIIGSLAALGISRLTTPLLRTANQVPRQLLIRWLIAPALALSIRERWRLPVPPALAPFSRTRWHCCPRPH